MNVKTSLTQNISWHSIGANEAVLALGTDSEHGLQEAEVKARLEKFGPNDFEKRPSFRLWKIIFAQIKSPLVLILIIAGLISILLKDYADSTVIFIAVLINTAVGAFQEGRASKAFDKMRQALKTLATVIRGGKKIKIDTINLVPGDLILVQTGDRIPADARILESKAFKINESALTGEWAPVEKNTNPTEESAPLVERTSMIWLGTSASEGWAKAVVTAIGEKTEFGKIAELVKETGSSATPFQRGVRKIALWIGAAAVFIVAALFTLGLIRGHNLQEMFLTGVAVAVAIVPEGLPVAVTVVLAIGMRRIMQKGGLVRKLSAAETLGSASVILTDKTGTLTQGKMEAVEVSTCMRSSTKADPDLSGGVYETLKGAVFASAAFIENPEDGQDKWRVRGGPTDQAMFLAGVKFGLHPPGLFEKEPRIDFVPFEAERRYSASLHQMKDKTALYVAGAPETLFQISDRVFLGNEVVGFDMKLRDKMSAIYSESAGRGERVIAVAYREDSWLEITRRKDHMFEKTIFLGLISFSDSLRPDAVEIIQNIKNAGIKLVLLTGDNASTAKSIAESAGLVDDWSGVHIVEGSQIEDETEKELMKIVPDAAIFARVLPHQKSAIVGAWQALGEVVAMTGDGVNDAPALRKADIGVAIGSGTDVAKEAANIVLTDDNLSVIFHAIEEGRVILDNLRKIMAYILSANFSEIVLISGALLLGFPLPILPGQILWANIVQEGFMNFALAFEPKEKDILKRDPKSNSSKRILDGQILKLIFWVGLVTSFFLLVLFLVLYKYGLDIEELRTIMFAGLSLDALFFAFSFKSLRRSVLETNLLNNPYLIFALIVSFLLLMGALYLGPLNLLLKIVPPTGFDLAMMAVIAVFNLVAIEVAKYLFIRRGQGYSMKQ